jgi:DNA repair protein RecO (recombination protein O)
MTKAAVDLAVVLRSVPLGEADLLVVLLCRGRGKTHTAARNARRSTRRFAGGLASGARGRATMARGRGQLARLDGFVSIRNHMSVGRDLTRLGYVAYLCELTDELVLEGEPDDRLFALLWTTLEHVVEGEPRPVVLRRFELGLLRGLGLLPALERCCVCGDPVLEVCRSAEVAFDDTRGGVLCRAHAGGAGTVSREIVETAVRLARDDGAVTGTWNGPADLEPPATDARVAHDVLDEATVAVRKGLRELTLGVLRQHLRRPLRSASFFASLAQGDGGGRRLW